VRIRRECLENKANRLLTSTVVAPVSVPAVSSVSTSIVSITVTATVGTTVWSVVSTTASVVVIVVLPVVVIPLPVVVALPVVIALPVVVALSVVAALLATGLDGDVVAAIQNTMLRNTDKSRLPGDGPCGCNHAISASRKTWNVGGQDTTLDLLIHDLEEGETLRVCGLCVVDTGDPVDDEIVVTLDVVGVEVDGLRIGEVVVSIANEAKLHLVCFDLDLERGVGSNDLVILRFANDATRDIGWWWKEALDDGAACTAGVVPSIDDRKTGVERPDASVDEVVDGCQRRNLAGDWGILTILGKAIGDLVLQEGERGLWVVLSGTKAGRIDERKTGDEHEKRGEC
jgi:hypothetical protein